MAVQKNTTRRKGRGRLRGVIVSAVSFCVLAGLALLLVPGVPGIGGLRRWLTGAHGGELSGEFHFSQGMDRVFADLGDGVAAVGGMGIQVLGATGEELFHEQIFLAEPAVDAAGGRAVVYDIGGKTLRVIDSGGVLASYDTEEPIVSASINENGWYCITTGASDGFKNKVTVYSDKHRGRYKVEISSGYVLGARLSRDNKSLAVLSITDTGGRVSFYSRDSEEQIASFDRDGDVILAISWVKDSYVLAVTKTAVLTIGKSGQGDTAYDFSGKYLSGMCITGGDFIALYLLDYGVGSEGRIVTLGRDGGVLAELETTGENRAMSVSGDTLAVLWNRSVTLYDGGLNEKLTMDDGKSLTGVLALSGGKVFAIGPREARVLS